MWQFAEGRDLRFFRPNIEAFSWNDFSDSQVFIPRICFCILARLSFGVSKLDRSELFYSGGQIFMWRLMGRGWHGCPKASSPNFSKDENSLIDTGLSTFIPSKAVEIKFPLTFNTCTFFGTK